MKLKNLLIIIGIPVLAMACIICPWFLIYVGLPNPPQPEITYGEFPFRLEYEINGKRMVIEDTLICEYDDVGWDEGRGKYRKCEQRLASGNERITLLKVDDTKEIYYPPGGASYYMDDMDGYVTFNPAFPNAAYIEKNGSGIIRADELLKQYGIKLISWNYPQPIKNNFSATK